MTPRNSLVALVALVAALSSPCLGEPCGDGIVRGVNIGGMFMLEPWITPKLFEDFNEDYGLEAVIVDEYTLAQYADADDIAERLDKHWDTWVNETDLQDLYDSGISHVRVPIPYWIVDVIEEEPFPDPPSSDDEGMRFYLKRFVGWCENVGLKVLIDLHGAPGSQNGFDNSGRRGDINFYVPEDGDETNVLRTYTILTKIADMLNSWIDDGTISEENLYGFAILNEPSCQNDDEYFAEISEVFNPEAYNTIRPRFPDSDLQKIVIHNAFRDLSDYIDYMPDYEGVVIDVHNYQAFTQSYNDLAVNLSASWPLNIEGACNFAEQATLLDLPTVTGEWCLAVTDCQKYCNGGMYSPYVPMWASDEACEYYDSDWDSFTDEYKEFLTSFMLAQLDAYEQGAGWFFWNFHTEDNCAPEWDYLFLLRNGIAPENLCDRPVGCA